jgi:hypothetical protein
LLCDDFSSISGTTGRIGEMERVIAAFSNKPIVCFADVRQRQKRGWGEGTTRRQPRPASSLTVQPCAAASFLAVASSICEPIGFVGSENAGSSASTSVSVTTATGSRAADL